MTEDRQEVSPDDVAQAIRTMTSAPWKENQKTLESLERAIHEIAAELAKRQHLETQPATNTETLNEITKRQERNYGELVAAHQLLKNLKSDTNSLCMQNESIQSSIRFWGCAVWLTVLLTYIDAIPWLTQLLP